MRGQGLINPNALPPKQEMQRVSAWYQQTVKEWETKYGVPSRAFRYDPTETVACCVRCGHARRRMSRHHIANDFLFATLLPDIYASRYLEFRKNEVAKLCDGCHKRAHRYYLPIVERVHAELEQGVVVTEAWCEKWRAEFVQAFEKFLNTRPRNKKSRLARKREKKQCRKRMVQKRKTQAT